ncbi:hypothetical protein [Variovorax sp. HJSM1_2]|uniref:hypothetical protein n=1 Tax=Variovorax sp. HJSM1_2 TaxID=3366263 RepID=UPI003BE55C52
MNLPRLSSTGLRALRCAAGLAASALLAACASSPQPPVKAPEPTPTPPASAASAPEPVLTSAVAIPVQPSGDVVTTRLAQRPLNSAVLNYADRTRAMSPADLAQEIARLGDLPDAVRSPLEELQFAVALGQTRNSADLNRALGATQRVLGKSTDEALALQPLARLLNMRYAEQKRVEELLDKQNQALRDSQRRNDLLNERLEAMRALERSLNSRPLPGSIRNIPGNNPGNGTTPHQAPSP